MKGLVKLKGARAAVAVHVPVYVAVTGLKTLRLRLRISDGAIFIVNDIYTQDAVKTSKSAASKFQFIAASVDDDRMKAFWLCRQVHLPGLL